MYNGEQYIDECVASILNQSFNGFEFIMIDDGSTDGTLERLEKYTDPRIKIFSQSNIGIYSSANNAVSLAKGSLIAVLDADDYSFQNRLKEQVLFMKGNPDFVFCGPRFLELICGKEVPTRIKFVKTDDAIRKIISQFNPFAHSSIVYRKDSFLKIGGYNESFKNSGDFDFLVRMLKTGKGCNLDQVLLVRRIHRKSISWNKEIVLLREVLEIKWKTYRLMDDNPLGTLYSLLKNLISFFISQKIKSKIRLSYS